MNLFRKFAVSMVLALGGLVSLYAQNREVSGKVLDAQQQPIIGAAVMLSGGAMLELLLIWMEFSH